MNFNYKTKRYLEEMEAVLINSCYKVFNVDFHNLKAFVNKQDTYRKRNGKTCKVEHHFGQWIYFSTDDILYGKKKYTNYTSGVYGLEECQRTKTVLYLSKETKSKIVSKYQTLYNSPEKKNPGTEPG